MKFLTLIAVNLVVLGAFLFRNESSKDNQGQSAHVISSAQNTASVEAVDSLPFLEEAIKGDVVDPQLIDSQDSRRTLLEEYWQLLLGDMREEWCPSKKVDMFHEMRFLMTLQADEALEYLEALTSQEEYLEFQEAFTSVLINQIAAEDPREAVVFMLQSGYEFEADDYSSVIRQWMDRDGPSIMNWIEEADLGDGHPRLEQAFYAVYAEENPFMHLQRFGTQNLNHYNYDAAKLLYKEHGLEIFDELKVSGLNQSVLTDTFHSIGLAAFQDDPKSARDWLLANRFAVKEGAVNSLTEEILNYGSYSNPKASLENLEWAITQDLVSVEDRNIMNVVKRIGDMEPEMTRETLARLESRIGESATALMKWIPQPNNEEEEVFQLHPFVVDERTQVQTISCFGGYSPIHLDEEKVDTLVASLRNDPISGENL